MLSCRNKGVFPDLAIRITSGSEIYSGGELIELKDSKTYSIASFNSTIPGGTKRATDFISGKNSKIFQQMAAHGEDPYELPEREVYYLLRGRKNNPPRMKVCLVHGHFFETVKIEELIKQSFSQVLAEGLSKHHENLDEETIEKILSILSRQEYFRKVREVKCSSVKLRFRIMTEAKSEANILDAQRYPLIQDNTLNFVIPFSSQKERDEIAGKIAGIFGKEINQLMQAVIKHPFNGNFLLFQTEL